MRIYDAKKNIIACFANVTSFRDLSINYSERVVVEEGSSIWNSDQDGYRRESKQTARKEWVDETKQIKTSKKS